MKIFLIGLPGSGKTTIGRKLAQSLQLPFVDLDKEIESEEGTSIPLIFKLKKESYFRELESSILRKWCAKEEDFVMATGGGAPCFFDNIQVINRSGKSVFLDVPASEIARRIARTNVEERPLLAASGVEGLKDHIEFTRSSRLSYYRQATTTVSGINIRLLDVLEAIKK